MRIHEKSQVGVISGFVTAIRDYLKRCSAIRDLRRMSDLQIADIGIERGRIPELVDGLMAHRSRQAHRSQ
ncbi:MAG: hypothetical protein CMM08_08115 [Rhodospirillaceae bacterium]|jgi:uncharacterized protein YjiS (DUF1127 family)|nr:hypothetical protein [Rhodospirillaceae bacterium]MDP6620926.1 hypothetical protein [Alphaproteobacteria bacterium]|tara:strand:- start:1594 stop:1803 length:210 start_codon:yes stop_codon:yes gene_type:complete